MTVSATAEPFGNSPQANTILRARQELAAAIRRGDYQPNQRLIEGELTAALGISRPTLRAVFVALEQDDYISLERNRGARVRHFSPDEAVEILVTREILEAALAGLAAERIERSEREALEAIVARMGEADEAGDAAGYSACNREFHALLISAARQPWLTRCIAATPYPLVMAQYRDPGAPHPRPGSLREHRAILAAVCTGNRPAAEAAMRHHLGATRRALGINAAEPARSGGAR
ncbi:GntR family transcriptional regulator [Amycolatopsis acidicola]|uniref:GntR family transcriptional regulator n=1 Tax=Amycolatopsis acidicola TaxID=2596893 RepID=A0A5N0V4R0_9PSEU|nr:GntR family transcriptional regulator [Amycolatopsis acidicola]KAA9160073.1 GntR family transcriptional regulator [Amycolatopsis acidicola]